MLLVPFRGNIYLEGTEEVEKFANPKLFQWGRRLEEERSAFL